jgi:hypothetical protein
MSKLANKNLMIWLLSLPVLVSCLFTLTGTLGTGFWLPDLTSHFSLQYLEIQVVGMALLLKFRPRVYLALGFSILILMSLNLSKISVYYQPASEGHLSSKQTQSTVLP